MELKQISNHIYKLTVETNVGIPIIINTWYIVNDDNVYIVDSGMNSYSKTQIKAALFLGTPQALFLTHGHGDHINGAKEIAESLNIPIYAHEMSSLILMENYPIPINRSWSARMSHIKFNPYINH